MDLHDNHVQYPVKSFTTKELTGYAVKAAAVGAVSALTVSTLTSWGFFTKLKSSISKLKESLTHKPTTEAK